MRISFIFAWYDFWIGWYFNRKSRQLYILPIPMLGIKIQLGVKEGFLPDIF